MINLVVSISKNATLLTSSLALVFCSLFVFLPEDAFAIEKPPRPLMINGDPVDHNEDPGHILLPNYSLSTPIFDRVELYIDAVSKIDSPKDKLKLLPHYPQKDNIEQEYLMTTLGIRSNSDEFELVNTPEMIIMHQHHLEKFTSQSIRNGDANQFTSWENYWLDVSKDTITEKGKEYLSKMNALLIQLESKNPILCKSNESCVVPDINPAKIPVIIDDGGSGSDGGGSSGSGSDGGGSSGSGSDGGGSDDFGRIIALLLATSGIVPLVKKVIPKFSISIKAKVIFENEGLKVTFEEKDLE